MTPWRPTARLARWQMWLVCTALATLLISGCAWLLLHYFGQTKGEFGPEISPFEPWMLQLHGFALIPGLLGLGTLMVAHIPIGWAYRGQRVAGVAMVSALTILIASGYLLYYLGDEDWRTWVSIVHSAIGIAGIAVFAWHYLNGRSMRRR